MARLMHSSSIDQQNTLIDVFTECLYSFLVLGKPMVVTYRAYSKDQILKILQQRLMVISMFPCSPSYVNNNASVQGTMILHFCVHFNEF